MTPRLFVAGLALTGLAFASERQLPRVRQPEILPGNVAVAQHPAEQALTTGLLKTNRAAEPSDAVFTSVVMEAVRTVDRSLIQLQPLVREEQGPRGKDVRRLAAKAAQLNERARNELEAGNEFVALEFVLQANNRVEDLRDKIERP